MIPVSTKIKAAFQSDSMPKTYYIVFSNSDLGIDRIDNTKLLSDSITLTEPLCSEEQLHYGRCESATFEFEMYKELKSLRGEIFDVYLVLGDYYEEEDIFKVGRYIVDEDTLSDDRNSKSITAYDIMYILNGLDITYWCWTLQFPLTIKQLRDSLMEYVGQAQAEKTLVNDDIVLGINPFTENDYEISFEKIMTAICEWNGVFGHINREGLFDYINLTYTDNEETYPSTSLFPSKNTFPKSIRGTNYMINPHLIKSDIKWSSYMCKTIDAVQVRKRNGYPILEYHIPDKETNTNVYVIQDNWLVDAMDENQLRLATENFSNYISKVSYMPVDANVKMDLSMEVGDAITLTSTEGNRIPTYILSRTMKGITCAFDNFVATGYEEFINDAPNTDGAMQDLMEEVSDLDERVSNLEEDGGIQIISVKKLPEVPKKNVLYLIQGTISVN